MQVKQERTCICHFCKKVLNPLLSVVLAAEVEKLGNCLNRGVNFPELSCLSCARQVVRVVHSCTVIVGRFNEPLEKLIDSPDQCTTPTTSSKQLHRLVKPLQRNTIKMET